MRAPQPHDKLSTSPRHHVLIADFHLFIKLCDKVVANQPSQCSIFFLLTSSQKLLQFFAKIHPPHTHLLIFCCCCCHFLIALRAIKNQIKSKHTIIIKLIIIIILIIITCNIYRDPLLVECGDCILLFLLTLIRWFYGDFLLLLLLFWFKICLLHNNCTIGCNHFVLHTHTNTISNV